MPTLAIESGWTESLDDLQDGMNLLLLGSDCAIRVVIMLQWTKLSNRRVSGIAQLFMRNREGIPELMQNEVCP